MPGNKNFRHDPKGQFFRRLGVVRVRAWRRLHDHVVLAAVVSSGIGSVYPSAIKLYALITDFHAHGRVGRVREQRRQEKKRAQYM